MKGKNTVCDYEMEELIPIVATLADKYTSKQSTSVSYEIARQLMDAVVFCINEYTAGGSGDVVNCQLTAQMVYESGYTRVINKVKQTQEEYNHMIINFNAYGNENYYDTVVKAIPGFFLYYDPRFAPQDTIITLDYPVLVQVYHLNGIDAIQNYVQYISIEQRFLSGMPMEYVMGVLSEFQPDYRKQFFNICQILLRHILGNLMIHKELTIESSLADYERLKEMVSSLDCTLLQHRMSDLLENFIANTYGNDPHMLAYLREDLCDFSVELKNAAIHNQLKQVVII